MWIAILTTFAALAAAGAAYVVVRFHRFPFVRKLAERSRILSWLVSLFPIAVCACFLFINVFTAVVVLVHLALIWMLCDIAGKLILLLRHKERSARYPAGAAALLLTAAYLGAGWFAAHHVFLTNYTLYTDKDIGADSVRIVLIADAHIGITLDGEAFARQTERIAALSPDLVVIAGDFVDDDTKRADLQTACEALGRLAPPGGVWYVYGNHDKGYYNTRDFTAAELRETLEDNGVRILEDEAVSVGALTLVGRRDRSDPSRAPIAALTAGLDPARYSVVLDHQPNDYENEAAAGVDLVLSGHTHGGHLIPAGPIGLALGANDRVYGLEAREDTAFIVTSGISGWGIPFKTGAISEIAVIDLIRRAA